MTTGAPEHEDYDKDLLNEEVLNDETILSYGELVTEFVESQAQISELIDPELGEAAREEEVRLIRDEIFIESLSAVAALELDSDGSGVFDGEDLDDTLIEFERSAPSILDFFIGTAYAEVATRRKLTKVHERLDLVKVELSNGGTIDFQKAAEHADVLFNMEEVPEEDKPIIYAFTTGMLLTLHDYYETSSTEPTVDEVIRALKHMTAMAYGWEPWKHDEETALKSYGESEDSDIPRSDTVVLAEFFVDVMYKSMEASGDNEAAFTAYLGRLWDLTGIARDPELVEALRVALNIEGARKTRSEKGRERTFASARNEVLDNISENDLEFSREDTKKALAKCRRNLKPEDRRIFESMFISGKFDEKDFEKLEEMEMKISVQTILKGGKLKRISDIALSEDPEAELRGEVLSGALNLNSYKVSDLFDELGLTSDNLDAAYFASNLEDDSSKSLPAFDTDDVAAYLWANRDKQEVVKQAFREYAYVTQRRIDMATTVEPSDEYESGANILSGLMLMLSKLEGVGVWAALPGGALVAWNDVVSFEKRVESYSEGEGGFIPFIMNVADYSLHNMNLLPYLAWMDGSKWKRLAHLGRGVVSPGIGNATMGRSMPQLAGIVGAKIAILDVFIDLRIDDVTGEISVGIPTFGFLEQHTRNWSEDAWESLSSILHLIVCYASAERIKNIPSVLKLLEKLPWFKNTPGSGLRSELGLNHGEYKSTGDVVEAAGKKLSPEEMRQRVEGVTKIEKLNAPVEYRGQKFTHKAIIMQNITFDKSAGKRIIVRVFNEGSGDYFDIEYILNEENVQVKRTVGEVQSGSKKVGRLRHQDSPFNILKQGYNEMRTDLISDGEGGVVEAKKSVDIPGLEDRVSITSEPIQAESARGGRVGTRYLIERTSSSGKYILHVEHFNDGAVRLSLAEDGVFTYRERGVGGRFTLLENLRNIDPTQPYVRNTELGAFDPDFFRDAEGLFSRELDRFVEQTRRTTGPIDGSHEFHFNGGTDAAERYLTELNSREKVKSVLEGFGEDHITPAIEEMDFTELRNRYASMGEVVVEAQPRSFNGQMFNKKVILVNYMENGDLKVTVRLFQDKAALKAGGKWDRLRSVWASESYCDVTYTVRDGAVVGESSIGEWTSVKKLGRGNTAQWIADYAETRSLVSPGESYLENLDVLRNDGVQNIFRTPDRFRYAGEMEIGGERRQFTVSSERQPDGRTRFIIEVESDGRFIEIYRNENLPEGRISRLLAEIGTDSPVIDGGLYAEDGTPLVLSEADEMTRYRLNQELDAVIRTAESRTRGAIRILTDLIPVDIYPDEILFDSDFLGPRQEHPSSRVAGVLEERLQISQPSMTEIVELRYPLKGNGGVFTHTATMTFEGNVLMEDGSSQTIRVRQELLFDLKNNVIERNVYIDDGHPFQDVLQVDDARTFMRDYTGLMEHVGEDGELRARLSESMEALEERIRSGEKGPYEKGTTAKDWLKIRKEKAGALFKRGFNKLPPKVREVLTKIHMDERGQVDPVRLVEGIIDFFVGRPANALYGPDTNAGQFLKKLKTDPAYRQQFFEEMGVKIKGKMTPKMNAFEGIGVIFMTLFAIMMADQRLSAANADEAGKAAGPAMVGFGVGMGAGMVVELMVASLRFVKAAPGIWGKAIAFAGGFVAGLTAGMWAHHALGVPLEKRYPMASHYVGAGGEILFSGGAVTNLLVMGATQNTDDIYVWMNESVPGITFNFTDPERRWVDLDNIRWHAEMSKDWTVGWNEEIDARLRHIEWKVRKIREKMDRWSSDPLLQMSSPNQYEVYEQRIFDLYDEMDELETKKIRDDKKWRDGQLVELIDARDMLDQGRSVAKAHLRMTTVPSRAIHYIHELGAEYLPPELYEKILDFEERVIPEALQDGDSAVVEKLADKLYQYRVMATAILVPHVNAIEFYKGGFGGAELDGREREEAERFDVDGLVDAEAVFLEQPAGEPYFSKEKGLESSIMGTPGAETLEQISEMAAEDGRPYLSQSVAQYVVMQDAIASRVVTLDAYDLLPPDWEKKAEELRREKRFEELPEELQFLVAFLEDLDEAQVIEEDI